MVDMSIPPKPNHDLRLAVVNMAAVLHDTPPPPTPSLRTLLMSAACALAGIEDILFCIFSYLDPEACIKPPDVGPTYHAHQPELQEAFRARVALFRLAISYRSFTGPALNILWRTLPGDRPLIILLCSLGIACKRESARRRSILRSKNVDDQRFVGAPLH